MIKLTAVHSFFSGARTLWRFKNPLPGQDQAGGAGFIWCAWCRSSPSCRWSFGYYPDSCVFMPPNGFDRRCRQNRESRECQKGQFMAPWDIEGIIKKMKEAGNQKLLFTERGVSFGYNNLVSDFRALAIMRSLGYPVVFDATHSGAETGRFRIVFRRGKSIYPAFGPLCGGRRSGCYIPGNPSGP